MYNIQPAGLERSGHTQLQLEYACTQWATTVSVGCTRMYVKKAFRDLANGRELRTCQITMSCKSRTCQITCLANHDVLRLLLCCPRQQPWTDSLGSHYSRLCSQLYLLYPNSFFFFFLSFFFFLESIRGKSYSISFSIHTHSMCRPSSFYLLRSGETSWPTNWGGVRWIKLYHVPVRIFAKTSMKSEQLW